MSFILSLIMLGASARATKYPSGFAPPQCHRLLVKGATVPSLTTFKKMPVRDKVRDVHALAFVVGRATEQADAEVMDQTAVELLSDGIFTTFGSRLQVVSEIDRARLKDYADELREVSFNLLGLGAVSEHLDLRFVNNLWAFSKMIIALPYGAQDQVAHNWRALTFLTLALVESDFAKRAPSAMRWLSMSLTHLREAEVEDAQGQRGDVAYSGLPEVFDRILSLTTELSASDLEKIDNEATGLLIDLTRPFYEGAVKPPYFADLAQGLVETEKEISEDDLPRLAEALADFTQRFTKTQNLN